jgi:hypothetical protein
MQCFETENVAITNLQGQSVNTFSMSNSVLWLSYPPTKLDHVTADKDGVSVASERRAFPSWKHRSLAWPTPSITGRYFKRLGTAVGYQFIIDWGHQEVSRYGLTDGRRFETLPTARRRISRARRLAVQIRRRVQLLMIVIKRNRPAIPRSIVYPARDYSNTVWGSQRLRVSAWGTQRNGVSRVTCFRNSLKPLTPKLNPSSQRCLTRLFTTDFAS